MKGSRINLKESYMDSKELGKKALSCIDLNKLGSLIIDDIVFAALKKVVDDSSNKFDDAAYAMAAPLIKVEIEKQIAKLIADLKD